MKCPFCQCKDTKVTDSRVTDDGNAIRRRRECLTCQRRRSAAHGHQKRKSAGNVRPREIVARDHAGM